MPYMQPGAPMYGYPGGYPPAGRGGPMMGFPNGPGGVMQQQQRQPRYAPGGMPMPGMPYPGPGYAGSYPGQGRVRFNPIHLERAFDLSLYIRECLPRVATLRATCAVLHPMAQRHRKAQGVAWLPSAAKATTRLLLVVVAALNRRVPLLQLHRDPPSPLRLWPAPVPATKSRCSAKRSTLASTTLYRLSLAYVLFKPLGHTPADDDDLL